MKVDVDVQRTAKFEDLFRSHYRPVHRFVAVNYPRLDSDEIVACTFEVAWRRFDDAPVDAYRGWLFGIARNHARNTFRSLARRASAEATLAAIPVGHVSDLYGDRMSPEVAEQFRVAFALLAPDDREVIGLACFWGLFGAELGLALGVSAGTASKRLQRARQRLTAAYGAGQ